MARSDLLVSLVEAAADGDELQFKRTVDAVIAEERAKHHDVLANRLAAAYSKPQHRRGGSKEQLPTIGPALDLALEIIPRKTLDELILEPVVRSGVLQLIEEHRRSDLLRSYGLEPRNRLLFVGPPGNGKTSLAEAIAEALMVPLFVARYEAIVANLLGDTAKRIDALIRNVSSTRCVLFFDEFDAIGKFRGDENESGEIKRLVSSLLGHLDRLAPHVVIIAATNHPELLDRAVWRRFNLQLTLEPPSPSRLNYWIETFLESLKDQSGVLKETLQRDLRGRSFSELDQFAQNVRRRFVLDLPGSNLKAIILQELKESRPLNIKGQESAGGRPSPVAVTKSNRKAAKPRQPSNTASNRRKKSG